MALVLPVDDLSEQISALMMKSAVDADASKAQEAAIDANRFWSDEQKAEYKEELRAQKDEVVGAAKDELRSVLSRHIAQINTYFGTLDDKISSLRTSVVGIVAAAPTAMVPDPTAPNASASALAGLVAQKSAISAALADCDVLISQVESLVVVAGLSLVGVDRTVAAALVGFGTAVRAIDALLNSLPF